MIEPLIVNGHALPFTDHVKHLGHHIDNSCYPFKKDMKIKHAMVIQKCNEICQEFSFCHPSTKLYLNQVYNSSYTGCQLWNLFCQEAIMIENSFNVSIRTMLGLPYNTHRYMIQPLANGAHVKQVLAKRFLQFCQNLMNCPKKVIRDTYEKIKSDVRTTTGSNLAELSCLLGLPVTMLHPLDVQRLEYENMRDEDKYRISFVNELLNVLHGNNIVDGFSNEELNAILHHLCVS